MKKPEKKLLEALIKWHNWEHGGPENNAKSMHAENAGHEAKESKLEKRSEGEKLGG